MNTSTCREAATWKLPLHVVPTSPSQGIFTPWFPSRVCMAHSIVTAILSERSQRPEISKSFPWVTTNRKEAQSAP